MALDIIRAIEDPNLLGAHSAYRGGLETFANWMTVHRAIYGLPLDADGEAFFERLSGRKYRPPEGGWGTVVIVALRQVGKSLAASTWVAYEAVRPGPRGTWAILAAQDSKGATRALLHTIKGFFRDGVLAGEAVRETADTVELDSGCTVAVWPTRPVALRGVRARIVVLDEADFLGSDGGEDVTRQMIQAARPTCAVTEGQWGGGWEAVGRTSGIGRGALSTLQGSEFCLAAGEPV